MRVLRSAAFASVSLLSLASPAWAQADPQADEGEGVSRNEIIVTARRREEAIQDIPAVVNAVTAESIEKLNLRRLEDIATVVPGLQMTANANGIGAVTTIRGVNFDVNQSGNNGTVQYYYNDAPLSAGVLLQAMYDLGQVSVERGTQGTLRGRAAPSGSINVTTRRPHLSEFGGSIQGTANTIHGWNINGGVSIPVIRDKLAIRLAGVYSDDEGNRVKPVVDSVDLQNKARSGRVSVRADPFDGVLLLDFTHQVTKREAVFYGQNESMNQFALTSTVAASPVTITAKDRASPAGIPSLTNQFFRVFNYQAQLRYFGQRLTYVRLDLKQHFDAAGSSDGAGIFGSNQTAPLFTFNQFGGPLPSQVPTGRTATFGQPTDTRSNDTTQEVRLQNEDRIAGIFDYVAGFLHYRSDSNTFFDQVIGGCAGSAAAPCTPGQQNPPRTLTGIVRLPLQRYATSTEKSVFGNIMAHFGNAELSAGVRHIWFTTDSGLRTLNPNTNVYVENNLLRVFDKSQATVYVLSGKYNFSPDFMAYFNHGTSWRPNTIVIGGPALPTAFQASFLKTPAEKSRNWEVGLKTDLMDRKLTLNLSGYIQKYKNYPYRTGAVTYFNQQTNQIASTAFVASANVEVKGIEGEISFRPNRNISLGATFSYADGKVKNTDVPCLDLNSDGVPDVVTTPPTVAQFTAVVPASVGLDTCPLTIRANNAPPFSASFNGEYMHPIGDKMNGFLRGLLFYKGASLGDPTNAFDNVGNYALLNLYAGIRDPGGMWELSLYGKNITNTFRVLGRSNGPGRTTTLTNGAITNTNYFAIGVTEPREFGVNLRWAFGSR